MSSNLLDYMLHHPPNIREDLCRVYKCIECKTYALLLPGPFWSCRTCVTSRMAIVLDSDLGEEHAHQATYCGHCRVIDWTGYISPAQCLCSMSPTSNRLTVEHCQWLRADH